MHAAIWFFPLLGLITIILILLALHLLLSSQRSQKKKRTNAFIHGNATPGSRDKLGMAYPPRDEYVCQKWSGTNVHTDGEVRNFMCGLDHLPDYIQDFLARADIYYYSNKNYCNKKQCGNELKARQIDH